MIELGASTEDEMVSTFLRGEVESSRFAGLYGASSRVLMESRDAERAAHRRELLGAVRGFGRGTFLFSGFPPDVSWRRVQLEAADSERLKYSGFKTWVDLSGGTRKVSDGASNIGKGMGAEDVDVNVPAIVERIRAGDRFEDLIMVEGDDSDLILIEGHARATAYVLARELGGVTVLLGTSPGIRSWAFF